MQIVSLDTHKHYSLARVETGRGKLVAEERIEHRRGVIRSFLQRFERGSPVAVETSGNYYWIAEGPARLRLGRHCRARSPRSRRREWSRSS